MVGFAQSRAQDLFSTENVERQIAIGIVIAVEEPPFLLAVQRQIGSIHVQDDLSLLRLVVRFDKHLHQQFVHRIFPKI